MTSRDKTPGDFSFTIPVPNVQFNTPSTPWRSTRIHEAARKRCYMVASNAPLGDILLRVRKHSSMGPLYDEVDASWKPPHLVKDQYHVDQGEDLVYIHPSLVRAKSLWLLWEGTMFRRILWNIIMLMIWAAASRLFLAAIGMDEGIIDSSVSQLITVLIFVLGIIMGNSINMGMFMFQRPLDSFRGDILYAIIGLVRKSCSYCRSVGIDATVTDSQVVDTDQYSRRETHMSQMRTRCIDILESIKLTCICLPLALFEEFAPMSARSVINRANWLRTLPSIHELSMDSTRDGNLEQWRRSYKRNGGVSGARPWNTEMSDLRLLSLCLEECIHVMEDFRSTFPIASDVDAISNSIGWLRTWLETRVPEPYLNLICLFVYAYLLSFPLFFSVFKWWLDAIVYFVVCYVILGTYELSEQLRKERGFDNKHTYIPFVNWINEVIDSVVENVDGTVKYLRTAPCQ